MKVIKYNYQNLLKMVEFEAKNLRKLATKDELQSIQMDSLVPSSTTQCLYGQMTGCCNSERAMELFYSCNKYFVDMSDHFERVKDITIERKKGVSFSPIEEFLIDDMSTGRAATKNLVNYLKGKTKKLDLNIK